MNWQKILDRLEREAAQVLARHPAAPPDGAATRATVLVAAAKRVRAAAACGDVDAALNELLNVGDAYDEMMIEDRAPTFSENRIALMLKTRDWDFSQATLDNLERGARSYVQTIRNGQNKKVPQEAITAWQREYEELLSKNPRFSKIGAAKKIAELKIGTGYAAHTIRQNLKKPQSKKADTRGHLSA